MTLYPDSVLIVQNEELFKGVDSKQNRSQCDGTTSTTQLDCS